MAWDDIGDAPATPPAPTNLTAHQPLRRHADQSRLEFQRLQRRHRHRNPARSTNGTHLHQLRRSSHHHPIPMMTQASAATPRSTTAPTSSGNVNNSAYSNQAAGVVGLIGSWEMEDASGANVGDSSGYGNNGTINGTGVTWGAGKVGGGLSLNGTSGSYVSVPNSAPASTPSPRKSVSPPGSIKAPQPPATPAVQASIRTEPTASSLPPSVPPPNGSFISPTPPGVKHTATETHRHHQRRLALSRR